jgi:hypothetical protein
MLRLLYQLADETKLYPNFLTLKGVELAVQPFAGSGFADVFEGKYDSQKVCVKVIRVFGQDKQSELLRVSISSGLHSDCFHRANRHMSEKSSYGRTCPIKTSFL